MENGNLRGPVNLTQCLSPSPAFPLQSVLIIASTRRGECVLLRARAAAGRSLGHFNIISKKGTRAHEFQGDRKRGGEELL